jgi:putative ABC transport system permease protein
MRDLALGATAVMGGVFLLSVLIGGPLGILLGGSLSGFARTLVALTQLAASPGVPIVEPLVQAIGTSFLIFAFALGSSLVTIRRMPVIEAVVGRREVHRVGAARWRLTAGVAILALVIGLISLLVLPGDQRQLGIVPFLVLLGALSIATPTLMGAAIRRLPTFSALGTGRELAFNARRTATLLYVFALAIAMAIALQGAATSLQDGIAGGVRAWTGNYLFVQPAQSGANLQDDKFASNVGMRLGRIRGVSNVGYFTYSTVELHKTRVPLWTWGPNDGARYANLRSTQGPAGAALWQALGNTTVAISSNYARLYGAKVGDRIAVPAVDGQRTLRVVAIVEDLTTTAGMLLVAPQLYTTLTKDQRIYEEILKLAPTASPATVQHGVQSALASQYPSVAVYDQHQIRDRFNALTSQLVQAFVVFGRIMFVLALLIGGATLATSMSLRQRSFALTRLVGAPVLLLRQQLRREALALGMAAWLIAAPVGIALVYALVAAIAAQSGLLPQVELPVALVVLSLPLAIGMSVLSLFVAAPRSRMPVTVVALAEE